MSTLAKIIVTCSLALLMGSCHFSIEGIAGSGSVIKKEKTLTEEFYEIKVSRGLNVILVHNSDHKVVVEANENLHDLIKVYVDGETLIVTSEKNINRADEKNIYVSYQNLEKIVATSGADITSFETVEQKNLRIKATSGADIKLNIKSNEVISSTSSGAKIELSGKVNKHKASASSGSNLEANDLLSLVSEASASSGSSIDIYAKKEFIGKVSSGADIYYYGNPSRVDEDESSGGDIHRKD